MKENLKREKEEQMKKTQKKKESFDTPGSCHLTKPLSTISNDNVVSVVTLEDEDVDWDYTQNATVICCDVDDAAESHKQLWADEPTISTHYDTCSSHKAELHYENVDKNSLYIASGILLKALHQQWGADITKDVYTYGDITKFFYGNDNKFFLARAYGQASFGQSDSQIDWDTLRKAIHKNIHFADFNDDKDRSILKTPYSYLPYLPIPCYTPYYHLPPSIPSNEQTIKMFLKQSNDPT